MQIYEKFKKDMSQTENKEMSTLITNDGLTIANPKKFFAFRLFDV
jgi:hypothetical protein